MNSIANSVERLENFKRPYWALIPLLALVAYISVLRVGFLADDLILLNQGQASGIDLAAFVPGPPQSLYRPVGFILTWQIGWQLWGFHAFPFHIVSLLLHSMTALLLGLWTAAISNDRTTGWLAGALFAVFPLHLEAVGWIAAQWDVWAALFGLLSLWLFALWLRSLGRETSGAGKLYALSLLSYFFGVFSKESLLAFPVIFLVSAWLVVPLANKSRWKTVGLALIPYVGVVVLNAVIRLIAWGQLSSYERTPPRYSEFAWDAIIAFGKMLLSPINAAELGVSSVQTVGLLSSVALLAALVLYGNGCRRLIFVATVWICCALLPILDLFSAATDLRNNRLLYLASAGYCLGAAVLIRAFLSSITAFSLRRLYQIAVGALLIASAVTCWLQLRPWQVASVQAVSIDTELQHLIPPRNRPQGMIWYVQDRPFDYKGALVYINGLGNMRYFTTGDTPAVADVKDAKSADLSEDQRDAFAMDFGFASQTESFHVVYLSGLTTGDSPPATARDNSSQMTWNFANCDSGVIREWQPISAEVKCSGGQGLLLQPTSGDPQLIGPALNLHPPAGEGAFLRIRVSMVYSAESGSSAPTPLLEWFWRPEGIDWNPGNSQRMGIRGDGQPHTYWTFIAQSASDASIAHLRFDPVSVQAPVQVLWIAVDFVE